MSDAPWDNTPHDQATDAFYEAAKQRPGVDFTTNPRVAASHSSMALHIDGRVCAAGYIVPKHQTQRAGTVTIPLPAELEAKGVLVTAHHAEELKSKLNKVVSVLYEAVPYWGVVTGVTTGSDLNPVLLAIKPPETQPGVARLYFTLDELKFLGNIFDARCKGFEGHPAFGINNAMRTMFREAQYGLEPYRG